MVSVWSKFVFNTTWRLVRNRTLVSACHVAIPYRASILHRKFVLCAGPVTQSELNHTAGLC